MINRKEYLEQLESNLQRTCDNMSEKIDKCLEIADYRAATLMHMAQLKTYESFDKAERLDEGRPTEVITSMDMIRKKVGNTLEALDFLNEEDANILGDGRDVSGVSIVGTDQASGMQGEAVHDIHGTQES